MNKQQRLVLTISILASFVAFLDGSVVTVALPAIVRELGGGLTTQQWVVDAYLITLGSLILVAGSFSDLFGRKQIVRIGLIGFAITSILCAIAPSSTFLIITRGLQGIAGALLVPSSLALIISSFQESRSQGKAIGTWTAWTGIAFVIGPLLGGFLVDTLSWRLIFAINVLPIVLTLGLLSLLHLADHPQKHARIDFLGATLCAFGLGGPVFALIEQSNYDWSNPAIYLPFIIGIAALTLFVIYEYHVAQPMLPLALFKIRNFSAGNIATAAIYAGLSLTTFLISVFIQETGHYTAIEAGAALLPVTIIMFLLSPRFGALANTYGPRLFMTTGPILGALGFLSMLRVDHAIAYWTQLFPGILLFSIGLSITVAPLTAAILGSIEAERAGIGSSVNNAVARIAGLIAIAAISAVIGTSLNLSAFHKGVIVIALLLLIGGLISWFGIQNPQRETAHS